MIDPTACTCPTCLGLDVFDQELMERLVDDE